MATKESLTDCCNETNSMINLEYNTILEHFKILLKKNKLKFTHQREIILRTLYNHDEHYSPEDLYYFIKTQYPKLNIGIATIYRTLNLLEDACMATSISFGTEGKKYELANKPHHDHMICNTCGQIIEFESEKMEKIQLQVASKYHFTITNHLMQLQGICGHCVSEE